MVIMYSFGSPIILVSCLLVVVLPYAVTAGSSRPWKFYLEDNASRMVVTTERGGKLRDCHISGDHYVIAASLKNISESKITRLDKKTMKSLTQHCTFVKWTQVSQQGSLPNYSMRSWMYIYPGTKWCGAGDIADNYEDLGSEVETDKCCREHDHCPDSIEAFGSKHGLNNNSPFTKSHCKCDDTFYKCLRTANTPSSNEVGQIYYNYIRMECFKEEHPIKGCRRYKGRFRPRCIEYELDKEQKPVWQFFDAKEYRSINEKRATRAPKQLVVFQLKQRVPRQLVDPPFNMNNETSAEEIGQRLTRSLVNLAMNEMLSSNSQKSSTAS